MNHQSAFEATKLFFPILLIKTVEGEPAQVIEDLGTGFFLFPDVLITCWHCVADKPPPGHEYAIRVELEKGKFKAFFLRDIERDRNGTDMATARCPYTPPIQLQLAERDLLYGEDVWAFGYPFPERRLKPDGSIQHATNGRYLRGYVTRHFFYEHPELGTTDAYELDMRAPQGTSGAALLRRDSIEVVGLVFGTTDIEVIEEFARVDPSTGAREPEVRRITSFALAYDTEALSKLTTAATGGIALADHIRQLQAPGS